MLKIYFIYKVAGKNPEGLPLYNTFFINGILDPIIGDVMNSVSLSK
jgi:hypothetical protein